jgi:hypothetical protein
VYTLEEIAERLTGSLCPRCGLPAQIVDRFTLPGVPEPVEHVKLVCFAGHWCTPPVDSLPAAQPAREESSRRSATAAGG